MQCLCYTELFILWSHFYSNTEIILYCTRLWSHCYYYTDLILYPSVHPLTHCHASGEIAQHPDRYVFYDFTVIAIFIVMLVHGLHNNLGFDNPSHTFTEPTMHWTLPLWSHCYASKELPLTVQSLYCAVLSYDTFVAIMQSWHFTRLCILWSHCHTSTELTLINPLMYSVTPPLYWVELILQWVHPSMYHILSSHLYM